MALSISAPWVLLETSYSLAPRDTGCRVLVLHRNSGRGLLVKCVMGTWACIHSCVSNGARWLEPPMAKKKIPIELAQSLRHRFVGAGAERGEMRVRRFFEGASSATGFVAVSCLESLGAGKGGFGPPGSVMLIDCRLIVSSRKRVLRKWVERTRHPCASPEKKCTTRHLEATVSPTLPHPSPLQGETHPRTHVSWVYGNLYALLPRHVLPILGLCLLLAPICGCNQQPTYRAIPDLPPVTAAMLRVDIALPCFFPLSLAGFKRHGDRVASKA
ncbi:hypothetical protein BJV74DRAFT_796700 [Russula compacta]|nr:hypothetical protein BJV74DRAFT_796700 [Russula compacta]